MLRPVRATSCYNDFGHEVVAGGEVYPVQALVHRAIRLDHTIQAGVCGSSFRRRCPSRHRPMDDRPRRHYTPRLAAQAAGADLTLMFRGAE